MPSNCAGGQTSVLHVRSHDGAEDRASYTTAVGADECDSRRRSTSISAPPPAARPTRPNRRPSTCRCRPSSTAETRANSHLLTAKVTLPEGAGLNPSVANGLEACTDAQFKKGTDDPIECPAASRIGSIEVETPALDQDLGGDLYVGQPLNNNPSLG